MEFYHHILKRIQEAIHVGFTYIQGWKYFHDWHGVARHLRKDMVIVKKRENNCLREQIFIHLVDHCPGCSQRHRLRLAKFDCNHQATLANPLEEFEAWHHRLDTLAETGAEFNSALRQFLVIEHAKGRQSGSHGHVTHSKG